jgi:hypothetical protein
MDNSANNPYKGRYSRELFSPEFFAVDFHEQEDQLTGITIGVHKNAATFTLTMATIDVYANRKADDDEDDQTADDVLVLPANEILPSDLIDIRKRVLESSDFDGYLVKQTY